MKNQMPSVIIGAILIVLALLIIIVPQFTSCQSQGKQITLQNGTNIPMKCYWTGQSELVAGAMLLIVGIMMIVGKRKETQLLLSILAIFLGIAIILLPSFLIGVCSGPMLCNTVMKAALIPLGALAILDSIVGLVLAIKTKEEGQ
jgi:uncharacterized membrane protein HdeD (DUF308 family)